MNFIDLVKKRKSVRKYADKPVEKEVIMQCLEAARLAPSACNAQPWHFIVVTDKETKLAVASDTCDSIMRFNKFTENAAALIVIVQEKPNLSSQIGITLKKREYPLLDIGISAAQFCLQAAELGVGTCMLGWYKERNIKSTLHIPSKKRISMIISMGYPASEDDGSRDKPRLDIEAMSSFDMYHR